MTKETYLCNFCKDKGYVYIQNGPDDVDVEPCSYCEIMKNYGEAVK